MVLKNGIGTLQKANYAKSALQRSNGKIENDIIPKNKNKNEQKKLTPIINIKTYIVNNAIVLFCRVEKIQKKVPIYCSQQCQHNAAKGRKMSEEHKENLRKSIALAISEGRWKGHNSGCGGKRRDISNIYFRSTFEANYARYLNFMNTKWEFEQKHLKLDDGRYYIPDFYIPKSNTIIEIKGRLSDTKGIQKYKLAKKEIQTIQF